MDHDDIPVGRLLCRRDALKALGAAGLAALSAQALEAAQGAGTPLSCVVRPEMTEGPYFLDKQRIRADVRTDVATGVVKAGVPLTLTLVVSQTGGGACAPLANGTVDLWQCDALGMYSGVVDRSFSADTSKQTFLRGALMTDRAGTVRFMTIYPGWYAGRAVHLHFKIRSRVSDTQAYEYTSQMFLPERLTDQIHAQAPYAERGRRDTTNERDGIYRNGGEQLLLSPTKTADGYEATLAIALDLADARTGRPDTGGMRGRGRGGDL